MYSEDQKRSVVRSEMERIAGKRRIDRQVSRRMKRMLRKKRNLLKRKRSTKRKPKSLSDLNPMMFAKSPDANRKVSVTRKGPKGKMVSKRVKIKSLDKRDSREYNIWNSAFLRWKSKWTPKFSASNAKKSFIRRKSNAEIKSGLLRLMYDYPGLQNDLEPFLKAANFANREASEQTDEKLFGGLVRMAYLRRDLRFPLLSVLLET